MTTLHPMDEPAVYTLTPPADPALLTPNQLAALADALAIERLVCAMEPADPLGFWPTAVAELLGHAEALKMQRHADIEEAWNETQRLRRERTALQAAATETAHELTYERQMRQQADEARDKLARRVQELEGLSAPAQTEVDAVLKELRARMMKNAKA